MKYTSLLTPIIFFFVSCQWAPEKVDFERETHFSQIRLVSGDSVDIEFDGFDLLLEDAGNEALIEVNTLANSNLRLIGKAVGQTQLTISYSLFPVDGSEEEAQAITYLDISVTEGIPLDVYLGEVEILDIAKYLSSAQLSSVDSISAQVLENPANVDLSVQLTDSSIAFLASDPGIILLRIDTFDEANNIVKILKFELNTLIRTRALAEIFTNGGCVNCPSANHNLDLLYSEFPGLFSSIRYHVYWTDPNDPMNLYNPIEVEDRRIFYGNSFEAPRLFINGEYVQDYDNYGSLSSAVSQIIDEGSSLHIWKPDFTETTDSILLNYRIENFGLNQSDLLCWSVLTQDSIYYAGTNGETVHMQVMRDMVSTEIPHLSGEIYLEQKLEKVPGVLSNAVLHLITILQDPTSRSILQISDYSLTELLTE